MDALMRITTLLPVALLLSACSITNPADERAQGLSRLGEQLFSDPRLSADGITSCASCHDPLRAFTDGRKISVGAFGRPSTRNAPSLLDLEDMESFFWDGRLDDLHETLLQPFTAPNELANPSIDHVVQVVKDIPSYRRDFQKVLNGRSLDERALTDAIAAYLENLDRGTNRYELAQEGGSALSAEEKRGLALFEGKAQCAACHTPGTTALTDNQFHHAGIGFERASGRIKSLVERIDDAQRSRSQLGNLILEDEEVAELGRFVTTRKAADIGGFRTPALRNVANTAPYMHDGSVPTLEEAVDRELYYRGIASGRPIALTVDEQRQLLAFLHSLSLE
ncbi:cytochrome-c peroxidase [Luteimonas fraxinea]|nr:cytochrome c peroxidase [Luteimonas fraxinea]